MCEWLGWHRLTTPFSRSPLLLLLLLALAADRAVFRASNLSTPLISSPRLPFFLRPSAIRTRQRGNTRAIYPVFKNASENPHVSCQRAWKGIHSSFPSWNMLYES